MIDNMMDTATRIRQILTEHLGVDEAPDTANLSLDLLADSLDTIEIAMALEDAFGIDLPDSAMETTATVADLIALVERVQKGAAA